MATNTLWLRPSDYSDGLPTVVPAGGPNVESTGGYSAVTMSGHALVRVSCTTLDKVLVLRDDGGTGSAQLLDVGINQNGTYNQKVRAPANPGTTWVSLAPSIGGTLDIMTASEGSNISPITMGGVPLALTGSNLQVVNVGNVSRRIVLVMDSEAYACTTTSAMHQFSLPPLIRADYPGRVSVEALGATGYYTWNSATGNAVFVDRIKRHSTGRGATTVDVVLMLSTNDYGLTGQARAAMTTQITTLGGNIISGLGTALNKLVIMSLTTRGSEADLGLGTAPQYRTAVSDAVTAIANAKCTYLDGSTFGLLTSTADYNDGATSLHWGDSGVVKVKNAVKTAVGY